MFLFQIRMFSSQGSQCGYGSSIISLFSRGHTALYWSHRLRISSWRSICMSPHPGVILSICCNQGLLQCTSCISTSCCFIVWVGIQCVRWLWNPHTDQLNQPQTQTHQLTNNLTYKQTHQYINNLTYPLAVAEPVAALVLSWDWWCC